MSIVVTGGAGFIGSNLIEKLLETDHVICIDNLVTGKLSNINKFMKNDKFTFINFDISKSNIVDILDKYNIKEIYNLASIASPDKYIEKSLETILTNVQGSINILEVSRNKNVKILLTSTSEVYGDPNISPQYEDYLGNVNCYGPRACYDESKRLAETLFYEYYKKYNTNIRIARIFNTYGKNMDPCDGRVISNFICQALRNEDITVYGSGEQTRSFCYVDDTVRGIISLMKSDYKKPVNIGNPHEIKIINLASFIIKITGSQSKIVFCNSKEDDPKSRNPSIELIKKISGWEPKVDINSGIKKTICWIKSQIKLVDC